MNVPDLSQFHIQSTAPSGITPDRQATAAERASLRTDADLIEQFLRERCSRSAHTENSYRAQLRRLGWFCRQVGLRSIRSLTREHWPEFQSYLRAPPPEHVMAASVGFNDPSWAPFRGPLAESSATQSEIVARAFFGWLADPAIGAIEVDPVRSIRTHAQRRSATRAGIERFINDQEWAYVQQAIAQMPADTKERERMRERARWVSDLAILTGLRASEIAEARVGMIKPGTEPGTYTLHITRKGGVVSTLPLMDEVIAAHRRYMSLYAGTWVASEPRNTLPFVLSARISAGQRPKQGVGAIKTQTRAHIWRIFKDVMLAASDLALQNDDAGAHERLTHASTHWLRHTFGTRLLDAGADIRSVRDLMDHASISTTNQYLHRPDEKLRSDLSLMSQALSKQTGPG